MHGYLQKTLFLQQPGDRLVNPGIPHVHGSELFESSSSANATAEGILFDQSVRTYPRHHVLCIDPAVYHR
jgi:hypothetical protein